MRIRRVSGLIIEPPTDEYRLTVPAREALERAGNEVTEIASTTPSTYRIYRITLGGRMPRGLVECLIGRGGRGDEQHRALRMSDEPEYPGEWPDAVAWHEHGQWVPCPAPRCGRALVWYEAGYVPGYRACTAGHHAQLSKDGRSAQSVYD